MKFLEFFNAYRETRNIIQMFLQVVLDLIPFLKIFVFLIFAFTFTFVILEVKVCDDDKTGFVCDTVGFDDYPSMDKFIAIFMMVFRNSMGDLSGPKYNAWEDRKDEAYKTSIAAIYIVWVIWALNLFITLIVMLNFLIAEVGNTYNKVSMLGEKSHYRQAALTNYQV